MSTRTLLLLVNVTLASPIAATSLAQPPPETHNPPDADLAVLVKGNTRFALDLYQRLENREGNLFLSPASISTALALTHGGARGDTATEMAKVLHFDLEADQLNAAFGKLLDRLNALGHERGCQLYLANGLWPQEGYQFLPEFVRLGKITYGAELHTVDYLRALELARTTINTWVEQHTGGKIRELLKPGILSPLTRLVLTNAIYFKGDWVSKFDAKATQAAPFTLLDGSQVQVPLMHQSSEFGYLEDDDLQVLELPYAGDALSMVVVLPRAADGLPALEKSLSAQKIAGWLSKLNQRKVNVALPRFKMTSEFELKDVLSAMGMRDAFTDAADFSGMDGTHLLFLSAVVHQAFVDVNEEGSEAAGATGAVIKLKSAPTPPPEFRADHPFLLLIRDRQTGTILFLGRLANPGS